MEVRAVRRALRQVPVHSTVTYQALDVLRRDENADVKMPALDKETVELRVPEHGGLVGNDVV